MSIFQWYLIIINIIAFVLYTIDFKIYIHGGKGIKPEVLTNIVTTFGGALGTLVAYMIWDRHLNKTNLMSRIYTVFWLIVQVLIYLSLYGPNKDKVATWFGDFYLEHKFLCWYIVLINAITFIAFAVDKIKANAKRWRIRETLLLGLSLIGGSLGGFLAMDLFNHKIIPFSVTTWEGKRKPYPLRIEKGDRITPSTRFAVGIPLMLALHAILLLCLAIGII